jgi:hypothetical protein
MRQVDELSLHKRCSSAYALSHIGLCSYPMYVGSAGAAYLPVMFADRIVLPVELAPDVSEKVVFMPETFYFNSHPSSFPSSAAASCPPSERSRWSLPASGVVLLNHNQFYKFDRFSFYTMLAPRARPQTPNPKPFVLSRQTK